VEHEILRNREYESFRLVNDASTCADLGMSDYCSVIEKPMNLVYIQTKVNNKSYETMQEFQNGVDLIVKNAFQYNHDPSNTHHTAAKKFQKKLRILTMPLGRPNMSESV
jgi:hypothetical protein